MPIVIASLGTYSGPAAPTLKPILEGAQLWVKYINESGKLNGHPVKLIVYDNGGDPARNRAQAQEAVERQKAIGFLANAEALVGQSAADYLATKRVPVLGVDGANDFVYDNPMYFVQHPAGKTLYLSFVLSTAEQIVPTGKTKLGVLTCAEAQGCTDTDKIFADRAKQLGLDPVYRGRASIAQPDFTAECLSARNAGVQTFFVFMDGNSVERVVHSCSRQGFHPQYASASSILLDRFKNVPDLDGLIAPVSVFPYFQTGQPGPDEFQQAVKRFGGGISLGVGTAVGWTAGKLLEKAAAQLPDPPTSEGLLAGLETIKDDTLDGLTTYPLTLSPDRRSERHACWINVKLVHGAWTSPDSHERHCGS